MVVSIELKGIVTEDGKLIVELPPEYPPGEVTVWIEPAAAEVEAAAAAVEYDPELEKLFDETPTNGLGLTVGEIASAPEIGSWADSPITDSAAYVEELRRRIGQRHQW